MQPEVNQSVIFNSWKEIAAYLRIGVRTAQRWERQLGLPVRRPLDRDRGMVLATREDLDHWLAKNWPLQELAGDLSESQAPSEPLTHVTLPLSDVEISNPDLLSNIQRSLSRLTAECDLLSSNIQQFRTVRQEISTLRKSSLPRLDSNSAGSNQAD